jgi:predicted metal-dependent enzyme (double-stranded beta helix superfamily)
VTPDTFPQIAEDALRACDSARVLSTLDLKSILLASNTIPQIPTENDYGNPALTIHREPSFRIEVVFWKQGPTVYIHDHLAGGAFAVVTGSRVQSRYSFTSIHYDDGSCQLGKVANIGTTVLRPGDVVPIPPRDGLIHSLTYLEPVSATLAVRHTCQLNAIASDRNLRHRAPETCYLPPTLRLLAGYDTASSKYAALCEAIDQSRPGLSRRLIRDVLQQRPLGFLIGLLLSRSVSASPRRFATLAKEICSAYPAQAPQIRVAIDTYRRYSVFAVLSARLPATVTLLLSLLFADASGCDIVRVYQSLHGRSRWRSLVRNALTQAHGLRWRIGNEDCAPLQCGLLGERARLLADNLKVGGRTVSAPEGLEPPPTGRPEHGA